MNKLNVAFILATFLLCTLSYGVHVINLIDKPILITTTQPEGNLRNPITLVFGDSQKLVSQALKLTVLGKDFQINELSENEFVTVQYDRENPAEIIILRSLPHPTLVARFTWWFPTKQPKKEELVPIR